MGDVTQFECMYILAILAYYKLAGAMIIVSPSVPRAKTKGWGRWFQLLLSFAFQTTSAYTIRREPVSIGWL